jgi:hypothetical protein
MSKDGPPSSSTGYRFGGLEALRAGLPPKAASPRVRTAADLEAGANLAAFTDYSGRVKSIGHSRPRPQSVSRERAAALEKIQRLEKPANPRTIIEEWHYEKKYEFPGEVLRLYFYAGKYRWYEEKRGVKKLSVEYPSRERALERFNVGFIEYMWEYIFK